MKFIGQSLLAIDDIDSVLGMILTHSGQLFHGQNRFGYGA